MVVSDEKIVLSQPSVVHSRGCGHPGDSIMLPLSYIARNTSQATGADIGDELVKLRYGVFAGLEEELDVTSEHFSFCRGLSVIDVIYKHQDFSQAKKSNFTKPEFLVTRQGNPKIVIVLENSESMNSDGHWHFIRTALRNLITADLPDSAEVGLVVFNTAAHIAHPLVQLGPAGQSDARQSLSLSIKSRHNLFPSKQMAGCVACGVQKAIETLQVYRSLGGVIIVISKGGNHTMSEAEQTQLLSLSSKHQVQLFSVSLTASAALAIVAEESMGQSWSLHRQDHRNVKGPSLGVYLDLIDIFRSIRSNTLTHQEALVIIMIFVFSFCMIFSFLDI